MGKNLVAPRKRGRPKKIEIPEQDSIEWKIASEIEKECGIPGCGAKWHTETANRIIAILKGGN